ncbi:MAG: adenylate cyclase regulatory domain-containing protein [Dehalococcoidia bacterium]
MISLEELSARTGEPEEALDRWRKMGLVGAHESESYRLEDVERARLVQLLLRRGIGLEAIARAEKERQLLGHYVEEIFPRGVRPRYSLAEAAELTGLSLESVRRFWRATGLSDQGDTLDDDDLDAMRAGKRALDAGLPEEALIQLLRVYADTLSRAAEASQRSFHIYVHERLRAQGMSAQELMEASEAVGQHTRPLVEPSILYFLRKGSARAMREDMVLHVAEEAGLLPPTDVPGKMDRAIAFVDLSSFTPLTEAMGDEKAAEVLERFSALVRESAGRWDGRVVKQIGDAFMLVFPDARPAVACALEIEERTAAEPQFPSARSGVHWGKVLYREGDYVGSSVNIASRVAGEAGRHQVLVTAAVRREAKGLDGVEFVRLGKRKVKGLSSDLVLFEARSAGVAGSEKAIDPVCGMEMGPEEVAARLTQEGTEKAFCSDECLRKYVRAPEKYGG